MDDGGSISSKGKEISLRHRVQTGSGTHSAIHPPGTRGSLTGDKAAGA